MHDVDLLILKEVCRFAYDYSSDPRTQNAAFLVKFNSLNSEYFQVMAKGANHFPLGVAESEERWSREKKLFYVEHAERNAIFAAARNGECTSNLVMYCPWFACADCARAIVQSGIRDVVGLSYDAVGDRWKESIQIGDTILEEGGVRTHRLSGKLFLNDEVVLLRDGVKWSP